MKLIPFLLILLSISSYSKVCNLEEGLTKKQIKALKSARRIDRIGPNRALLGKDVYTVDILSNDQNEMLVLLGEAHIKGPRSAIIGKKVAKRFKFRMLEGVPPAEVKYLFENFPEMKAGLGWGRIVARVLTFNFFGSTISAADRRGLSYKDDKNAAQILAALENDQNIKKAKKGINLPLEVGEFLTPDTTDNYILDARNIRMVDNINTYLSNDVVDETPLVIVGAAHNPGMIELLKDNKYEKCSNF